MGVEGQTGIGREQDFTMDGNVPTGAQSRNIVEFPRVDFSPAMPPGMGAVYDAITANRARQEAKSPRP